MTATPRTVKDAGLHVARQIKHRLFVARRRTVRTSRSAAVTATTRLWRDTDERHPYIYQPGRYRRSFLNWDAPTVTGEFDLPRRVLCVWTGEYPMSARRTENLASLRRTLAPIPVELVTPENLHEWMVPGHPLHPAYPLLSLVHRSDYLRAYLLHHHGGGYSDIKSPSDPWDRAFAACAEPGAWFVGYPERSTGWVAQLPRELGRDLRRHYRIVPGGSAFIARPGTTLTAEWLAEVERRLDYALPLLQQHPGGVRNEVDEYPFGWNDLLAKVLHPLALKHHRHVRVDADLTPDIEDYL